jgi:nitrate reductase NapD
MRTRRFEREEARRRDPDRDNILGVLLRPVPGAAGTVSDRLRGLAGVDVHLATEDGRLIVVLEDTAEALAIDRLQEVGAWPDVAASSLVFHHFEDRAALDQPVAETAEGEFLA